MKPSTNPLATATAATLTRVRRIEGQVHGISEMLRCDRPYDEILQQIWAARGALDALALAVVDVQTQREVAHEGVPAAEIQRRLVASFGRLLRRSGDGPGQGSHGRPSVMGVEGVDEGGGT